MTLLAFVTLSGVILNFLVDSVNAWHVEFSSKKECKDAVILTTGDTIKEANRVCERLIPHDDSE